MKGLKITSGIILILVVIFITPIGFCATSVNETVFLTPGQITSVYNIQVSGGDIVVWSFQTRDDAFNVQAFGVGAGVMTSSGKTSDSGSIEALVTGNIAFTFQNMDSTSGYIEINIYIQKETIEGFHPVIIIIVLISIVSVLSIRKMVGRTNHKEHHP